MNFLDGNVTICERVNSWEESIVLASQPLLDKGNIKTNYIDSMIENINELGFYIVLTDLIAMPHSRPENGVLETGMSLLKLNEPVKYGERDINLIFILAAKNNTEHIDKLTVLSDLLDDEEKIQRIINTNEIDKINEILKEEMI